MRKFWGLVINEYVKIICKASTKIMLVVIVLISLGFNALLYLNSNMNQTRYYYAQSHDDYISSAQSQKYEGWERDVEMYTFMKEHDIPAVHFHNEITPEQIWRRDATFTLFNMKYLNEDADAALEKYFEDVEKAIINKDWKLYYQTRLSHYEAEQEQSEITHEGVEVYIWTYKYKIDNNIAPDDWRSGVVDSIANYRQSLFYNYADVKETDDKYGEKMEIENTIAIAEYRLENNVESYTYDGIETGMFMYGASLGFWDIFATSIMTIAIVSVLVIVVAGSLLSAEFSAGTVKFLLINPVKRWKIFAAKYATVLSMTLATVCALYIFNIIFAGLFFGFSNLNAPYLAAEGGKIITGSSFLFVAGKYLLGSVGMVCMATFAFALSSLVRNSALAIGLGVFLYLVGNSAVQILNALGLYQAKYILFANTDLNAVMNGLSGFINHTLSFALINIGVYMFVFLLTAWDGFVRGDVK